jgi:hypothetical protein
LAAVGGNGRANDEPGGPAADARRRQIRAVIAVVVLVLLAFGTGALMAVLAADDEPAVAQSPSASPNDSPTGSPRATGTPEPSKSSSVEPGGEPTPVGDVLPDGRHFVRVAAVVDLGAGRAVRFDLAYFLEDEPAEEAAAEHGDEAVNGYYIVNDNPKLRTAPIAPDVKVTYISTARCCNSVKGDLDAWAESVNGMVQSDYPPADSTWWWFTARDGRVTAIDQQYLP